MACSFVLVVVGRVDILCFFVCLFVFGLLLS